MNSGNRDFFQRLMECRPPGSSRGEARSLSRIAFGFRERLSKCLDEAPLDDIRLQAEEIDELALAMTELAEDLHSNGPLWKSLETYHREFYQVPLPLVCKPGDDPPATFDERRFQFFLHTWLWDFRPDVIIPADHGCLRKIAGAAGDYFAENLARHPGKSSVSVSLSSPNDFGWDVKRKLVWMGTRSFLFRATYRDYLAKATGEDTVETTDDFLCRHCTGWSGLGPIDILAAALDLAEEERATLRGWHERHTAFYRVEALQAEHNRLDAMTAVNLINDQSYRIRMDIPLRSCPFRPDQLVFGSLVPWRGEWYWSGSQRSWPGVPPDFSKVKNEFIQKQSSVVYTYRPDLANRAVEQAGELSANFVKFHGSDLVVFPDGLSVAAAEQKRLRQYSERKAGSQLHKFPSGYNPEKGPRMQGFEGEFLDRREGIAVFDHPGEGVEMFMGYARLIAALENKGPLSSDEKDALRSFVEEEEISPAFVSRVLAESGNRGLLNCYRLKGGDQDIAYLLRRFKGIYYRKRYPCISLFQE